MGLKTIVKRALLGPSGDMPRDVQRGLLRGLRFHVDTGIKSQRLLGLEEREIAAAASEFAIRAASALDIGANDGWYSLFFASRPNIQKVYAFEPVAQLGRRLEENLALNGSAVRAKVSLVSKFVGAKDEGDWCSVDGSLPSALPEPILFKIDVDGGEMDVLRGAGRTLSQARCFVVLETHSVELERDCQAFLRDHGYVVRLIKNGWYRKLVPESRIIPHNRWLLAERA